MADAALEPARRLLRLEASDEPADVIETKPLPAPTE
jgi:hypothetical protein